MTSKERVRAAARREKPDRVPAAFEAVRPVVERLLGDLNLPDREALYRHFAIDTRYLSPPYIGPELGSYTNEKGNKVIKSYWGWEDEITVLERDRYSTTYYYPLNGVETVEEVDAHPWPDPDWFDYEAMSRECDKYPDKAIVTGHEGPFQIVTFLISMEEFFVLMVNEPAVAKRILQKMAEFEREYYRRIFQACRGKVDILRPHDDYGTQRSLLFSVDMWREFFEENTRELVKLAHRYDVFYQQHSCGAVAPLLPEFVRCGVDILEPLQRLPGLEPEELAVYGNDLTFHGGIDTQQLLPVGTPEQVEAEARRLMEVLGKNGGYILMSSQNFETDVPTANIEAVYRADRYV